MKSTIINLAQRFHGAQRNNQQSKKLRNSRWGIILCIVVSTIFTACTKDEDAAAVLIGEWTSVSTTGTIVLAGDSELDNGVEQTINDNIASYDLTDVVILKFGKDGVNVFSRFLPTFYGMYQYSINNNTLKFTAPISTDDEFFDITFNGDDEFSIKSTGFYVSNIALLVASALCDKEARERGYESAKQAGLQLYPAINLTITFRKREQ